MGLFGNRNRGKKPATKPQTSVPFTQQPKFTKQSRYIAQTRQTKQGVSVDINERKPAKPMNYLLLAGGLIAGVFALNKVAKKYTKK